MIKERKTERKHLRAVASPATSGAPDSLPLPDGDARAQSIALDAYYRAERRGFAPGSELADWLEAEAAFDAAAPRRHTADGEDGPASLPDEFN